MSAQSNITATAGHIAADSQSLCFQIPAMHQKRHLTAGCRCRAHDTASPPGTPPPLPHRRAAHWHQQHCWEPHGCVAANASRTVQVRGFGRPDATLTPQVRGVLAVWRTLCAVWCALSPCAIPPAMHVTALCAQRHEHPTAARAEPGLT